MPRRPQAPLAIVLPVRFHEAIRAAERRKVELPSSYYGELQAVARSQAFTISGLATAVQIREALDHMNEGLRQGMTFGEWKEIALTRGWGLSAPRLKLILRAHTQTAYNAGAWEQFERVADRRGYLMYSAINDSRTRPAHRAMDGVIRPLGDAFWNDHSPPCGYNCRCGLVSLTKDQVDARGGITRQISSEARADAGWGSKPAHGGLVVDDLVAREALGAPSALQRSIQEWHQQIRNDRVPDLVRDYVPDFDDLAADVESAVRELGGLIRTHEAVALRAYTGDYYGAMNNFLRGYATQPTPGLTATISAAASAVAKMPAFEGNVFRGVYLQGFRSRQADFLRAHVTGEVVQYQAFTSASYTFGFERNVQYRIRSRTGRDVSALSRHGDEDEVLFLPGTKFRVISAEQRGETLYLELEELADQSVHVPPSHRFAKGKDPFDRLKAGEKLLPEELASDAFQRRVENEAEAADPEVLQRFMDEHDGLTPMEWAMKQHPTVAVDIAEHAPQLLPKGSK